jgi:hypothetical protein
MQTGITERSIRTCLQKLKNTGELTSKTTNKYSIITLCNYDKYQTLIFQSDQQTGQQPTSNRPASDHKQEVNNVKNEKNKNKIPSRNKNCLMKNSNITLEQVKEDFLKRSDIKNADAKYYYNVVMDWSNSKGRMQVDWMAQIRNFARRDLKESKLKHDPNITRHVY